MSAWPDGRPPSERGSWRHQIGGDMVSKVPDGPPPVGKALVDWLKATWPNRLPAEGTTTEQLARLQGIQHVIGRLEEWHERQHGA